jgi:hypothetical protein
MRELRQVLEATFYISRFKGRGPLAHQPTLATFEAQASFEAKPRAQSRLQHSNFEWLRFTNSYLNRDI